MKKKNSHLPEFLLGLVLIETGIHPESSDHILTLSTCTGNGYDSRMTVHAVCIDEQTTDPKNYSETSIRMKKRSSRLRQLERFFYSSFLKNPGNKPFFTIQNRNR